MAWLWMGLGGASTLFFHLLRTKPKLGQPKPKAKPKQRTKPKQGTKPNLKPRTKPRDRASLEYALAGGGGKRKKRRRLES